MKKRNGKWEVFDVADGIPILNVRTAREALEACVALHAVKGGFHDWARKGHGWTDRKVDTQLSMLR